MTENEKIEALKKLANEYAEERFDFGWENLLKEDAQPWQRETYETAFKIGFFEGLGYAGRVLDSAVDD